MRKILLLLAGIAVLSIPAVSIAGGSSSHPSAHPGKAGTPEATKDKSSPANVCRSKALGAGSNAFGKCVSTIAKDKNTAEHGKSDSKDSPESDAKGSGESDGKNSASPGGPASTCRAMQANDLVHFQNSYGTRPNAFGKCVSGHANSEQQ